MIDKNYVKQKKIIVSFIGIFFLLLGNFLPLISISSKTIGYNKTFQFIHYEGKYIIILAIIFLFLLLLKEVKATLFSALATSVLIAYLLFQKSEIYNDCASYNEMFSWGWGIYTLILGNLLTYVAPVSTFLSEKFSMKFSIKIKKK